MGLRRILRGGRGRRKGKEEGQGGRARAREGEGEGKIVSIGWTQSYPCESRRQDDFLSFSLINPKTCITFWNCETDIFQFCMPFALSLLSPLAIGIFPTPCFLESYPITFEKRPIALVRKTSEGRLSTRCDFSVLKRGGRGRGKGKGKGRGRGSARGR